jgi:hypothetical protein
LRRCPIADRNHGETDNQCAGAKQLTTKQPTTKQSTSKQPTTMSRHDTTIEWRNHSDGDIVEDGLGEIAISFGTMVNARGPDDL